MRANSDTYFTLDQMTYSTLQYPLDLELFGRWSRCLEEPRLGSVSSAPKYESPWRIPQKDIPPVIYWLIEWLRNLEMVTQHTHSRTHHCCYSIVAIVAEAYGVELIDTQVKAICLIGYFFCLHFQQ
jgi:hypothetical protein